MCPVYAFYHPHPTSLWGARPHSHPIFSQVEAEVQRGGICSQITHREGFPDSSVHKESTCNAGDPSSIPGSGRSTGERIGYPLQYSWSSLVTQLVKTPPAILETWIQSLGWEEPLEKVAPTRFSILA